MSYKTPMDEIRLNLFEYIWTAIIHGVGGDGEAKIYLKETDAKQMAEEFLAWIKENKGDNDFAIIEKGVSENGRYTVWSNQEGFCFSNVKYEPHPYDDLVVIAY